MKKIIIIVISIITLISCDQKTNYNSDECIKLLKSEVGIHKIAKEDVYDCYKIVGDGFSNTMTSFFFLIKNKPEYKQQIRFRFPLKTSRDNKYGYYSHYADHERKYKVISTGSKKENPQGDKLLIEKSYE